MFRSGKNSPALLQNCKGFVSVFWGKMSHLLLKPFTKDALGMFLVSECVSKATVLAKKNSSVNSFAVSPLCLLNNKLSLGDKSAFHTD